MLSSTFKSKAICIVKPEIILLLSRLNMNESPETVCIL